MTNYEIYTYIQSRKGGGNTDTATLDALINRSITEINNDRVTTVGAGAFAFCTSLTTVNLPSVTNIEPNAFVSCLYLTTINLPVVTKIGISSFSGCARLTTADFPLLERISSSAFFRCGMLTTLVLRRNTVATLERTDAFTNTPIASGTGYIYVPDNQVDNYKIATNWVTYANQIKGISELEEAEW